MRGIRRWAIASALAIVACAGAAMGAELLGEEGTALLPSAPPPLLGPITETGRRGWDCAPEREARAPRPADARLPRD